jgi:hypothetical protein
MGSWDTRYIRAKGSIRLFNSRVYFVNMAMRFSIPKTIIIRFDALIDVYRKLQLVFAEA